MSILMWWPIGILFASNILYNVMAKKLPSDVNPFASLTLIYLMSAIVSLVIFFLNKDGATLIEEYAKFNWVVPLIAIAIVGMEVGTLYMYRIGWPISVGMLINNSLVSVALVFIGALFFKESVTLNQIIGVIAVLGGLALINK